MFVNKTGIFALLACTAQPLTATHPANADTPGAALNANGWLSDFIKSKLDSLPKPGYSPVLLFGV
jgi:hypothetical protein